MSAATVTVTPPLRRRGDRNNVVMLGMGIALVLLANAVIGYAVPAYEPTLQAFGMELPTLTRWLLGGYRWLPLAALLVPAAWAAWPNPARSGLAALLAGIVLAGLLIMFCVLALHLPVVYIAGKVA